MNSTPDPKETEPRDAPIAGADERLAHAHEEIRRADEQLARVSEQLAKMERDDARPLPARPGPQSHRLRHHRRRKHRRRSHRLRNRHLRNRHLKDRRAGAPWACWWWRASLSLPWSCRPMAAGPSWLSPVGRRSSLQRRHRRRKVQRLPRSPRHPSFKWPRPRQHHRRQHHRQRHRKQHPWPRLRPRRKMPRRRLPQRPRIRPSCCKLSRAISRIWSEPSNSSRRTSSKWPATIQKPLVSSRLARKR